MGIPNIGFMQGRLSPLVDGKIQAFPWQHWREEIEIAGRLGFRKMEWTLDQERLYENPLMSESGRKEIHALISQHQLEIPSLTGDCFMQAPFYKQEGEDRAALLRNLRDIILACGDLGIVSLLIPLVDGGRLENDDQASDLLDGLESVSGDLKARGVKICFESDFPAEKLRDFIACFAPRLFGITYDIGNSAALGFDPREEIAAYGDRILNVHVKDRVLGGTTVPLTTGAADLPGAFRCLHDIGYAGNYILQTARAVDDNHEDLLCRYRDMAINWIEDARR